MILSKEYVGYMAREVTKQLIKGEFIETTAEPATLQRIHSALLEEMSLEDRINDEVRAILEQYSEEMRKSGASYQEMFKKVKGGEIPCGHGDVTLRRIDPRNDVIETPPIEYGHSAVQACAASPRRANYIEN